MINFNIKTDKFLIKPEVEKWLEYVCHTVMPAPLKNECSSFVQEYGPIVIALLVKEVNPNQVCGFIGVCPKQKTELEKRTDNLKANATCVLCEFVLNVLSKYINTNSTEVFNLNLFGHKF